MEESFHFPNSAKVTSNPLIQLAIAVESDSLRKIIDIIAQKEKTVLVMKRASRKVDKADSREPFYAPKISVIIAVGTHHSTISINIKGNRCNFVAISAGKHTAKENGVKRKRP